MHKNRQFGSVPHRCIRGSMDRRPWLNDFCRDSSVSEKAWKNIYSSYACGCVSACVFSGVWIERPRSIFMALVQQISLNKTVNPQIFYTMSGIENRHTINDPPMQMFVLCNWVKNSYQSPKAAVTHLGMAWNWPLQTFQTWMCWMYIVYIITTSIVSSYFTVSGSSLLLLLSMVTILSVIFILQYSLYSPNLLYKAIFGWFPSQPHRV